MKYPAANQFISTLLMLGGWWMDKNTKGHIDNLLIHERIKNFHIQVHHKNSHANDCTIYYSKESPSFKEYSFKDCLEKVISITEKEENHERYRNELENNDKHT